jgi:hypothetical protein
VIKFLLKKSKPKTPKNLILPVILKAKNQKMKKKKRKLRKKS